ncbi:MAG: hypothetical protein IPL27_05295 [Lewinellaceae bacterium]|nr:hypothetical protein [Lewinellaceae bacterium]
MNREVAVVLTAQRYELSVGRGTARHAPSPANLDAGGEAVKNQPSHF